MRLVNLAGACALALAVSGCANLPWHGNSGQLCRSGTCSEGDALRAFVEANNFCQRIQRRYQSAGNVRNSVKLGIGLSGMVAGSVITPLVNGSAKDAWSGFAGAANGMQTQVDQAFLGTVAAHRAKAVNKAVVDGQNRYTEIEKTDYSGRIEAAVAMATQCSTNALAQDQALLKRLALPLDEEANTEGE